jgi:hypothetical protein
MHYLSFCLHRSLKALQIWNDSSMPAALLQDVPKSTFTVLVLYYLELVGVRKIKRNRFGTPYMLQINEHTDL